MEDQVLTCRDCGQEFTWTAGEQEFYASKNLSSPTRCKACRAKRRTERDQGRSSDPAQMHDITCADCGKAAQVPFKPSGDKPVYCRDCFMKHRDMPAAA